MCTYVHIHIYAYTYIRTYIHNTCIHEYIATFAYIDIYTYTYRHIYIYTCRDGAIHVVCDSQACLDRASRYLGMIFRRAAPPCWGNTPDGDLWAHFLQAVIAKGHRAIKLSKVKGHVTQAEIQHGLYNIRDKDGNDHADMLATRGRDQRSDSLAQIASFFASRQKSYIAFVRQIHTYNILTLL